MKKFSLLLCSLALLISSCALSQSSGKKSHEEIIDENLPIVEKINFLSDISSIALEWESLYSENISGFYIYRSQGNDFKRAGVINDKFQTHFTDSKLAPNQKYRYFLRSFNSKGHVSKQGAIVEISTKERLEAIPFAHAIKNLPSRIKLIWRPHPDLRVKSYLIERAKINENEFKKIAEVQNRLSAEFIDDNLKPNQAFKYQIYALTFDGVKSEPSALLSANSKILPPSVTHLNASSDAAGKIIITWDFPSYKDFAYYKIYASNSRLLPFTFLAQTQQNHYEDLNLSPEKSKYYKVSMVDKDGLESELPKDGILGKTLGLPEAPVIILARSTSEGINLEWLAKDARADKFEIKRFGGDKSAIFKDIKGTKFTDKTALAGVEYSYEVIAIDAFNLASKPSKRVKAAE